MKNRSLFSWKAWTLFTAAVYLLSTGSAFADTYNLYFKKAGPQAGPGQSNDAEELEESLLRKNEEAERKAEKAREEAKKKKIEEEAEAAEDDAKPSTNTSDEHNSKNVSSSKVVIPELGKANPTTIIINNNLSTPRDSVVHEPEPRHVEASHVETEVPVPAPASLPRKSGLKMIFSATAFFSESNYSWEDPWNRSNSIPGTGALFLMGFDVLPGLSLNGWVGVAPKFGTAKVHAGAEAELMPIRISMGSYNLIEIGALVGASTLNWAPSDFGPLHVGGRFNLNFNDSWGITTAARVNKSVVMWEGGFIVKM